MTNPEQTPLSLEPPARLRIYQYREPGVTEPADARRWVAAPDEEKANAAAQRKGWEKSGGEIFVGIDTVPQDRAGLKQFGVDVIVGGW